jgi:hypothetical protein
MKEVEDESSPGREDSWSRSLSGFQSEAQRVLITARPVSPLC